MTRLARGVLYAPRMKQLDKAALARVTGGTGTVQIGQIDMGPPKYSAAWWDFVRQGGAARQYK
jgi:hypothetical protein